jgi:PAS domain S-box-containing protein
MSDQTTALVALTATIGAAGIAAWLLATCVRHRGAPGAVAVGLLQLAVLVITGGAALVLTSDGGPGASFWYYARFIGYTLGPVAGLAVTFEVIGRRAWLRPAVLGGLLLVPAATLVLIVASPATFAVPVFEPFAGITLWRPVPGPWFAVYLAYAEALMAVVVVLLAAHAWRSQGRARARSGLLALGAFLPLGVDLATRLVVTPRVMVAVVVPLSFVGTGLVFAWVMLRHRFVTLSPLAIDLFDTVADPIYAFDDDQRLTLVNKAFASLVGTSPARLLGRPLVDVLPVASASALLGPGARDASADDTVHAVTDGQGRDRTFLISRTTLTEADGTPLRVGVMRDITARQAAEDERDRLLVQLAEALANVRTLRGFIPICAGCRKVRNDKGYWQAVEVFVGEQTEAQFSHGLCPECSPRYFPDADADH